MKSILEVIEFRLTLDGFVNTLKAKELRKYIWENSVSGMKYTIIMNHKMTQMKITQEIIL